VRSYFDLVAEEKMRAGMNPEQARRAARIELGGVEQVKEQVREVRAGAWLNSLLQDVRYGARMLRKNPGFTAIAVLTLALGIGANTAIFTVVNAVLIRPLPFNHPERIVLSASDSQSDDTGAVVLHSVPSSLITAWKQADIFESVATFNYSGGPVRMAGRDWLPHDEYLVDPDFLSVLGVIPAIGRGFLSEDSKPGHEEVAMISYELWQRLFHGSREVLGQKVDVDGTTLTIVGVTPRDFVFLGTQIGSEDSIFLCEGSGVGFKFNGETYAHVIARLKQGVSRKQAQAEIRGIAARIKNANPKIDVTTNSRLIPLHEYISGSVHSALLLMLAMAAVLLLIAYSNITNLVLSRAVVRGKEMAVRAALGASTRQLVQQTTAEMLCLCAVAGLLGTLFAEWIIRIFLAFLPHNFPMANRIHIDLAVLAFTGLTSLAIAIVLGLLPAFRRGQFSIALLHGSGRTAAGSHVYSRLQSHMTVAQVAMSLALLTTAGLLMNSLWRLHSVPLGYKSEGVLGFSIVLPPTYKETVQWTAFDQQLIDRLKALPGVSSVGGVWSPPPHRIFSLDNFEILGEVSPREGTLAASTFASSGYFRVLSIPLLAGRNFTASDTSAAPTVAVVNGKFARTYFPAGDAIGKQIKFSFIGLPPIIRQIVGVVGDAHEEGLDQPIIPTIYSPQSQSTFRYSSFVLRTQMNPTSLIPAIRSAVRDLDSSVPSFEFQTLNEKLYHSLDTQRLYMVLIATCAILAVLLVASGLYSVIAYTVSQKTKEIGIRMALGAQREEILKMVLTRGLSLAAKGIGVGLLLSLGLTQLLRKMLFEVRPADPLTFAACIGMLIGIALLASYVPARRAMRVDPMEAVRYE
jgi:predicted permease